MITIGAVGEVETVFAVAREIAEEIIVILCRRPRGRTKNNQDDGDPMLQISTPGPSKLNRDIPLKKRKVIKYFIDGGNHGYVFDSPGYEPNNAG